MQIKYSRKILIFLVLSFIILSGSALLAQGTVRVQIILTPALHNAQVVYLSNFDLLQLQTAEFLFQVTIDNATGQSQAGRLKFVVDKDGTDLVNALTNEFNLPQGITSFNNIELSNGSNPLNVKFTDTNVEYPNTDFQNEVLQGGKLPPGRYVFTVTFEASDPRVNASNNYEVINLVNSPFVQPVYPGVDDYANPEIIYTQFPVFQFNSNITDPLALLEDPFQIEVYQKEEYHTTADEVLSTTPFLDKRIATTLYQYPQGEGVQPLEPGTYVWRVKLLLQTTKGTDEISSPLFAFKYVDPSQASADMQKQIMTADILRMLRYLLGNQVDDLAKALNNYSISDMTINSEEIDMTALYNKINSYQGTVIKVNNLELQSSQK